MAELRRSDTASSSRGETRGQTIASFRRLAFLDKASCRAAQIALQEAPVKDAIALAGSLRGHVRKAMGSMYANYVLQKVVELTPVSASSFVAEELAGMGSDTARHRYGCRIICRLLEFGSPDEPATSQLFAEVLREADTLVRHSFGGYVAQHFLEFGSAEHKQRVGQAVRRHLVTNCLHKRGSRLVEAALQQCAEEDKRAIADELLATRETLLEVAQNQYGCHVAKALLRASGENRRRVAEYLRPVREQMRTSKYGKFVLAASAAGSV